MRPRPVNHWDLIAPWIVLACSLSVCAEREQTGLVSFRQVFRSAPTRHSLQHNQTSLLPYQEYTGEYAYISPQQCLGSRLVGVMESSEGWVFSNLWQSGGE